MKQSPDTEYDAQRVFFFFFFPKAFSFLSAFRLLKCCKGQRSGLSRNWIQWEFSSMDFLSLSFLAESSKKLLGNYIRSFRDVLYKLLICIYLSTKLDLKQQPNNKKHTGSSWFEMLTSDIFLKGVFKADDSLC